MLTKTQPDEIQNYLSDASYLKGGNASEVVFPETADEIAKILAQATRTKTPVTVSGAGTGTVAGRVPLGGIVIATDKLNHIKSISSGSAIAEAGVRLIDLQRAVISPERILRATGFHVSVTNSGKTESAGQLFTVRIVSQVDSFIVSPISIIIALERDI